MDSEFTFNSASFGTIEPLSQGLQPLDQQISHSASEPLLTASSSAEDIFPYDQPTSTNIEHTEDNTYSVEGNTADTNSSCGHTIGRVPGRQRH